MQSGVHRIARAFAYGALLVGVTTVDASWRWLDPQITGNPAVDLIHLSGRYLAISRDGSVVSSDGASNWEYVRQGTPNDAINSVAQYGAGAVAVGDNGAVLCAVDGVSWQSVATPTTDDLYAIAAGPAGFVAVGGLTLMHSVDGIDWRVVDTGVEPGFFGPRFARVSYGSGRYVVWIDQDVIGYVAPFEVLTSLDGLTWARTPVHLPEALDTVPLFARSLAYAGNQFIAGATSVNGVGLSLTSPDGLMWTPGVPPTQGGSPAFFRGIAYDPSHQRFIGFGDINDPAPFLQAYPLEYVSTDGLHWPEIRQLDRKPFTRIVSANARVFGLSEPGGAIHERSADGSWQLRRSLPKAWTLSDVAVDGERFVAVGTGPVPSGGVVAPTRGMVPAIVSSGDGVNWSVLSVDAQVQSGGLEAVASGAGSLVAVGRESTASETGPVAYLSRDGGASWTRTSLPPVSDVATLTDVAYAGGRFVATAASMTERNLVYLSSDGGSTWRIHETGQSEAFALIASAAGGFVATTAFGPHLFYSADGRRWTELETNIDAQQVLSIAERHGRYLAATGGFSSSGSIEKLLVSDDLLSWREIPDAPAGVRRLGSDPRGFTAVTSGGYVATSPDGLHWEAAWSTASASLTAAVHWRNDEVVVVTSNGGILAGSTDRVFRDGFEHDIFWRSR